MKQRVLLNDLQHGEKEKTQEIMDELKELHNNRKCTESIAVKYVEIATKKYKTGNFGMKICISSNIKLDTELSF